MTSRVLSPAESARVRDDAKVTSSRGRPEETRALLAGLVVHIDDDEQHWNSKQTRERHGRKLRSRADGEGGRYWWMEEIPPAPDDDVTSHVSSGDYPEVDPGYHPDVSDQEMDALNMTERVVHRGRDE